MFTQYVKNIKNAKDSMREKNQESGMALLVSVLILALIMGIVTAATLASSRSSVITSAQISESNAARTAALVGIAAMTRDAQNIHSTPNTATAGSSSCASGLLGLGSLLCGLDNNLLGSGGTPVAIPNGGNGGIAVEMPVGTTASATITNAHPYYQATVHAVVTANTFSPAQGTTKSKAGIITILSEGKSGHSSATAEAVIAAEPVQTTSSVTQNNAINMNGDTTFSGSVNVEGGSNGNEQNLSDNGSVSNQGGYTGFNNVYATQSISSSGRSDNPDENLFSNQNITLSGSGTYGSLKALGDISTSGDVNSAYAQANGTISLESGSVNTVISGDGSAGSGGVTLNNNGKQGTITTDGSVSQDSGTIKQLYADGNYTASSNPTVTNGTIGGTVNGSGNLNIQSISGYQVNITPLNKITVQTPEVNVYPLAADANFAFYPPTAAQAADGVVADVVVNNVNGFTSGQTYYLYNSSSYPPNEGVLCTGDTGYNYDCINIAQGFSSYNTEITYSDGQWTLNGNSVAPGVLWFDGSLVVENGTYDDSLLATGDISLKNSSSTVDSPNFAGPDAVCGYENDNYQKVYPTNFCTSGAYYGYGTYSGYNPASIGNIALYTGGYNSSGNFTGGDLSLANGTTIGGDIIAANTINTSGSTKISGYIVSGGEADNGGTNNFGGSTTIDLQNLPSTFTPTTPETPNGYSATAPYTPPAPETVMKLLDMYWLN
jgi:hypothetical protein